MIVFEECHVHSVVYETEYLDVCVVIHTELNFSSRQLISGTFPCILHGHPVPAGALHGCSSCRKYPPCCGVGPSPGCRGGSLLLWGVSRAEGIPAPGLQHLLPSSSSSALPRGPAAAAPSLASSSSACAAFGPGWNLFSRRRPQLG